MKHRSLVYGVPLPQDFLDALQEFLATHNSNVKITQASSTAVQIVGGTGDAQVSLGIGGLWRYNQATVSAAHPAGAAGQYSIWAVCSANSFTAGAGNETDDTDYSFGLMVLAAGGTPSGTWNGRAIVASRKIGETTWTGSAISGITNMLLDTTSTTSVATTILLGGTLAARPAAAPGNTGFYYVTTDTATLYQSTGSVWTTLSVVPDGAITTAKLAPLSVTAPKLAPVTIDVKSGAYSLVSTDRFKVLRMDSATPVVVTIPLASSQPFAVGESVDVVQWGTGQVTFTPAAGVTLVGNPGFRTVGQYVVVTLLNMAPDTWLAVGGLTP